MKTQLFVFTLAIYLIFLKTVFAMSYENKLIKEFLKQNSTVLQARANENKAALQIDEVYASKSWGLNMGITRDENELDSSSEFNFNQVTLTNYNIALAKKTFWGGSFSFETAYSEQDRSKWGALLLGSSPIKIHEFSQSLIYSQDLGKNLFGRNDRIDIAIAESSYKFEDENSKSIIEEKLFNFYQKLIEARLNFTIQKLNTEALKRAKKREALIRRRVRDGLRERVDFYQAQMAVMAQEEAVKSSRISVQKNLKELADNLHRQVKEFEITPFTLDEIKFFIRPKGEIESNKTLRLLKQKQFILTKSLKKIDYSFIPEINLIAQYKTNDFDSKSSSAFKNGVLGSKTDDRMVGIKFSWNIGNEPQKIARAKQAIDYNTNLMQKTKLLQSLAESKVALEKQLGLLDKNIKSVSKRRSFAKKVLKEYNGLYNLGKADLDQVIRAEEDLINTEKSYTQYLLSRRKLVLALAYLYGKVESYLLVQS